MCGLHAYDKYSYNLTDLTDFVSGRPLLEDSTINHIISFHVSINCIDTWLNALAKIFVWRCCTSSREGEKDLNRFLIKYQLLLLKISKENVRPVIGYFLVLKT